MVASLNITRLQEKRACTTMSLTRVTMLYATYFKVAKRINPESSHHKQKKKNVTLHGDR